jgi:histidinol-phosphate phosphatase family protein
MQRAVFLDRDDTLNHDPGYLRDPEQLELLPGVADALATLQTRGFVLIVVTNQSGVGRGYYPIEATHAVNARMSELLAAAGVTIARYEICPHAPDDGCDCRKPSPKMILGAAAALEVDCRQSWMVGDKESDVEAGIAAGCRTVRIGDAVETKADFCFTSLAQAVTVMGT